MKPVLLLLIIPLAFIAIGILPSHAAQPTGIQITYPTFSTILYGNGSLVATGTFTEFNATLTPTISISLDGTHYTPNVDGNTWSIYFSNISGGWHTIIASLSDTQTTKQDSVQFLIINGHVSIPKLNILLLKESSTCLALLKSHTPSSCPTLGQLKQYDTSNQFLSGTILQKSDGTWYRTPAHVKGWWNFINKTGNPVICVECDFDYSLIDQAQIIFLNPNGFVFASPNPALYQNNTETYWNGTQYLTRTVQQETPSSTTFQINFDRYVSPDCLTANISYSPMLLGDTISYMENGCKKTNLITSKTLVVPQVPFDTEHCTQCHYEQWLNQVKQGNSSKMRDPNDNPGYANG